MLKALLLGRKLLLQNYKSKFDVVVEQNDPFTSRQRLEAFVGTRHTADGSGWETLKADRHDVSIDRSPGMDLDEAHRFEASMFVSPSGTALPVDVTIK